jgi:hypothetical protein
VEKESDLFSLIKTLTRSEKGYFKKFTSLHVLKGENTYVKLFDAIEAQAEEGGYNEPAIKEKFKTEKFIRQLPVTKNYLYKNLLKALNAFHYGGKPSRVLKEGLLSVEILTSKGLYAQAHKLLKKLKALSIEDEKFIYLLEILSVEGQVLNSMLSPAAYEKELERIAAEESLFLQQYNNLREMKRLSDKLILLTAAEGMFTDKHVIEKAKEIISHPLFLDEELALSLQAKIYFYHTRGAYYFAMHDGQNAYRSISSLVALLEANRRGIYEREYNYILTLQNLIYLGIELKFTEDAAKNFLRLKQALEERKKIWPDKIYLSFISRYYTLRFLLAVREEVALPLNELVEAETLYREKQHFIYIEDRLIFASLIGRTYFFYGSYEKSLEWINIVLNFPDQELRPDMQVTARIMNLIIHYELGNLSLLEYIIKSTYRYLLKRKKLFEFEKLVIGFLKKTPDITDEKSLFRSLRELQNKLLVLKDKAEAQSQPADFNYMISWIERKQGRD